MTQKELGAARDNLRRLFNEGTGFGHPGVRVNSDVKGNIFPDPIREESGYEGAIWGWYHTIQVFVPDKKVDAKREKALNRIAEIERELAELKKEV